MGIIDRYIFAVVANAVLAVMFLILSIHSLAELVDELGDLEHNYNFLQALFYILLKIPSNLSDYISHSALIGSLVGLGILANAGELTVIRAAGVSTLRLGWMAMKPVLLFVFVIALITEFVAPDLEHKAEGLRNLLRGDEARLAENNSLWIVDGEEYVQVETVHPNGWLTGVTRYRYDSDLKRLRATQADEAEYEASSKHWQQSYSRWTEADISQVNVGSARREGWSTALDANLIQQSSQHPKNMSIRNIYAYANYLGQDSKKARVYQVEFWQKLLSPLAVLALVFVAVSFVFGSNRQVSVGERIFFGVIAAAIFRLAQDILSPASIVWGFSPFLAVMLPILGTLLIGLLLLRKRV